MIEQRGNHLAWAVLLFWAISAGMILWIGEFTNLDIWLADRYYDAVANQFPWKDTWVASVFFHQWLKDLLILAGAVLICLCVLDLVHPFIPAYARIRLRIVALSAMLVPAMITFLKHRSFSHCPWDLERYHGFAPYVRLLEAIPDTYRAGHCLPAGHASTALWLASLAVFWIPHKPRVAMVVACAGLLAGCSKCEGLIS